MGLSIRSETNLSHIFAIIFRCHQILQVIINHQIIGPLLAYGALVLLGWPFAKISIDGEEVLQIKGLEMARAMFGTHRDGDFGEVHGAS
jgi:hypothetical protein